MSNDTDTFTIPRWQAEADAKLFKKGAFKLKLGSKTIRFKYQEDYSEARRVLSFGRFKGINEMIDAVKRIPNGY